MEPPIPQEERIAKDDKQASEKVIEKRVNNARGREPFVRLKYL